MKYEIDIFHYIRIYKKEGKRMLSLIIAAAIVASIVSFLQPSIYKSTAIVLSPKEGGQAGGVGRALGIFNISISSSFDDVIFSMLKSARMRKDINAYFKLNEMPRFWWSLDTYTVTGGFAVEVKGPDPDMTEKITNFAIENLDKINSELQVTPQRPMVKVLDSAVKGTAASKGVAQKVAASSLFVFGVYFLLVFFREYFAQIKASKT